MKIDFWSLSSFFLLIATIFSSVESIAQTDSLGSKRDTGKEERSTLELSPGLENYSAHTSFAPGNYFYFQGYMSISQRASAFLKYSADLTPHTFDHSVLGVGLRALGPRFSESMVPWASLFYIRDVQGQADHLGIKVCLLGEQDQDMTLGVLPITLTYRLSGGSEFGIIYELFTLGVRF